MTLSGRRKKGLIALAVLAGAGLFAYGFITRNVDNHPYADPLEHFKYGSLGTEKRLGIPVRLFDLFPVMFADLLPEDRPGTGYEKLGFLYEKGHKRPIGTTLRSLPVELVGLNCAACHTATLREVAGGQRQIVYGAGANNFDIESYIQFLIHITKQKRFNTTDLLAGIESQASDFGLAEKLLYRFMVLPRAEKELGKLAKEFDWLDKRPPYGPGRVDTFNPYKVYFKFDMSKDDTIGTSDFPSLFNQKARAGMSLHWDGNNDDVAERNISAAIGAGAQPDTLDMPQMNRIVDWVMELKAPAFPLDRVDMAAARRGKPIWEKTCANCHDWNGARVGKVTPVAEVGTDPERERSFTAELAEKQNTLQAGDHWKCSHFHKTGGYANAPLDGVWLRSPYLHNGSVPTLRALLFPEERPAVFYRGHDVYDYEKAGYVAVGPEAEKAGFRYDTALPGNHNGGHLYGTDLAPAEKIDLIEYLKTL